MKQELLQSLGNLKGFLLNIDSINKHPYSKGVDVDKLVKDLEDYVDEMKDIAEKIEEVSTDVEGQPEENPVENN